MNNLLLDRGIAQILPDRASLEKRLTEKPARLYLGIDPTGSFLHLGHSVVLRKLRQFADAGHEVILLIGNGTVKIGDPTGRDDSRPMLTDEAIEANFANWQTQASKILDFSKIKIQRNGDWLNRLDYVGMIQLLAKTTVQQLLERDMFQNRLQKGLPIFGHEIIYPLLQGYDSVAMDVDLEIGGSDQTFNMLMGRQLQKSYNNREKWILSTPIINGLDGRKMSKSFNNYIALTEEPRSMYAKTMSAKDEVILEYFTLLTDVSDQEIAQMAQAIKSGENPIIFKKILAKTLTTMYHNEAAALEAADFWQKTVAEKKIPENLPKVVVPSLTLPLSDLAKIAQPNESKSNLRRLAEQGGLELLENDILRIGKRHFFKLITQ